MLTSSAAKKRRKETFEIAEEIHGGSIEFVNLGAVCLMGTVLTKCCPILLGDFTTCCKKFKIC